MKKFIPLLLIPLICGVTIFSFFYYFGHHDDKALTEFSAAYQDYDRAISDLSATIYAFNFEGSPRYDDQVQAADLAQAQLALKGSARISSLTRHDAEIMGLMTEIAGLSAKELAALKSYQTSMADNGPGLAELSNQLRALTTSRQADYTRFQELSGY